MNELTLGTRVAVYTRCSTTQQVNSIADQDAEVMQTVERYKLHVVKTYSDEGVSGSTINERPALQRMIAEIGRLDVTILLVYNLSRLTRGGLPAFWKLFGMFMEQGVRIYNCQSCQLIDEDNVASALQACLEANQADTSNKQHAYDITRTEIANVRDRGNSPGALPPYGYDRLYIDEAGKAFQQVRWNQDGTKSVLDPETGKIVTTLLKSTSYGKAKQHRVKLVPSSDMKRVVVVREIFHLAESTGYTGVADSLNKRNIPGPRGGLWNSSSIRDIVLNPAYAGDIVFNRTHKGRYYGIKDGQVTKQQNPSKGVVFRDNPKEEWIFVRDAHEPLIPREEWEAVQLALQTRSKSSIKSGRGANRCYPLSGILVCGNCGQPMHGMCVGKRRYICSSRRKHGKSSCVPCSVDAERAEKSALDAIRSYLLSECGRQSLQDGLKKCYDSTRHTIDDVESAQREYDKLQKRKNDLFAKLTGDDLDLFRSQIDTLKGEEERLQKRLAAAKAENGRKQNMKEFLREALDLYENHVLQLKGGCENAIRESLRALGTKMVYYPDGRDGTIEINPFVYSVAG